MVSMSQNGNDYTNPDNYDWSCNYCTEDSEDFCVECGQQLCDTHILDHGNICTKIKPKNHYI